MRIIKGKIEYALRDEVVNIFAMTYGQIPNIANKQIMICKKKKFNKDRLGPFLLDPKRSKPIYIKSQIGLQYEQKVGHKPFELKYIAFIEDQIEIKPSLALFQELKNRGIFSLWEAEAPFKYFEGMETGFLVVFRVYEIEKKIDERLLEKGRSGRNYYYRLNETVYYNEARPVIEDAEYNQIKQQLIEIAAVYNKRAEQAERTYSKPAEDGTELGTETPQLHIAEKVFLYNRDQKLSAYVKKRADGYCECCGKKAPFIKADGEPYLEEHHLIALSEGGTDTVDNVCAVCPNCHRELHYGVNKERLKKSVKRSIGPKA